MHQNKKVIRFESKRSQNEEKLKKTYFLYCSFLDSPLPLHFKNDLESLRRCSYNILNHPKWRRIEKDLPKCSTISISRRSLMSWFTLVLS
jgi:hypothetical protein